MKIQNEKKKKFFLQLFKKTLTELQGWKRPLFFQVF